MPIFCSIGRVPGDKSVKDPAIIGAPTRGGGTAPVVDSAAPKFHRGSRITPHEIQLTDLPTVSLSESCISDDASAAPTATGTTTGETAIMIATGDGEDPDQGHGAGRGTATTTAGIGVTTGTGGTMGGHRRECRAASPG
ncbi:hypothetical protein THAOC_24228, partial [Thalassiosira oceanica]